MHGYHAITQKLIGHLRLSLIIDQSESLVCYLFLHLITFLQVLCYLEIAFLLANQIRIEKFSMYITTD